MLRGRCANAFAQRKTSSVRTSTLRPLCSHIILPSSWTVRQNSTIATASSTSVALTPTPSKALATNEKPFYITTPIFYVNAAPHVGHLFSLVLADIHKRFSLLRYPNRPAYLCTGTDEHGMKVQQAALAAGSDPQSFTDKGAAIFKQLAAAANISNDYFIRTTDIEHKAAVEYAWTVLQERGYIYLSKHEGWYSVSDETFYPQSGVHLIVEPSTGRKIMASIETGKEVEWTSETNYKFRLSAFREPLLKHYKENPRFVVPKSRMAEVVKAVEEGLEDLSVSRPSSRLTWGIRVPTDETQTIYVWLDALVNYITKAGYPWAPGKEGTLGWPADVQVIGKDIVRFHTIYWPAFLLALSLPLPTAILTHAHWTLGRTKMSKSTGNVVNPFFALSRFGVDPLRFYLAHDGGISQDADYGNEYVVERYRKGLQGGLGNLASRVLRGKRWSVPRAVQRFAKGELGTPPAWVDPLGADEAGAAASSSDAENDVELETESQAASTNTSASSTTPPTPLPPSSSSAPSSQPHPWPPAEAALWQHLHLTTTRVTTRYTALDASSACKKVLALVYATNAYLQSAAPWTSRALSQTPLASTPFDSSVSDLVELDRTIYLCAESLRLTGLMLLPVMPERMGRLLDMLGVKGERRDWSWVVPGKDGVFGTPGEGVGLGRGVEGVLFPPLEDP